MPTSELIFTAGDLEVAVGQSGFPVRVRCDGRPGQDYLAAQDVPGELIMDGRIQRWEPVALITDIDETEARYALVDHPQLEYTVRNSFSGHWQQRHMLVNTSSATVRVERWELTVAPADGCVGWATAIGGDAFWSVQPADGRGPLLVGELAQGVVSGLVPGAQPGFATGEIVLPGNRRFVLQWRIDTAADTVHIARTRRPVASGQTELGINEPYEIADPDSAVVSDDPVIVSTEGNTQVVLSDRAGRYPVELRSGRGTTRIDLAWVPNADELITELSPTWLDHRTAAGVGVIPGPGAALGLQRAVVGRLTDEVEDAEDALALHTEWLLDSERLPNRAPMSIMDQAFLAQESVRTGDPAPLRMARSVLLDTGLPVPGLGLAATRICLAELALGGTPAAVIMKLRELATGPAHEVPEPVEGSRSRASTSSAPWRSPSLSNDLVADDLVEHLIRTAARLELITVTGPSAGRTSDDVIDFALAVGAELGSGLPGARIGGLAPSAACYAAAVLDLLPDGFGSQLERWWGITAHTLADRIRTSALAEALFPRNDRSTPSSHDLDQTIGWLVLGGPAE